MPGEVPDEAGHEEKGSSRKPPHQKPFIAPQEEPRPLFRRWKGKEDGAQKKLQDPIKEPPAKEVSPWQAPAKEAPVKEVYPRQAPVREAPVKETSSRQAPVREAPVKETSSRQAPVREAPVKETSSRQAPAREVPVTAAPVQDNRTQLKPHPSFQEKDEDVPYHLEKGRRLLPEMWEIVVVRGPKSEEGRRYSIRKESVTIGKGMNNDIVISDELLENTHIKIYLQDDRLFLQKLMKTQPIFINGKMLATNAGKAIEHGDSIQISTKTKIQLNRKL
jgi:hypothetical protein